MYIIEGEFIDMFVIIIQKIKKNKNGIIENGIMQEKKNNRSILCGLVRLIIDLVKIIIL